MPKTESKKEIGVRGEDLACAELERQGMQVLGRNWRCRLGEIDIVAAETGENGLTLVFCEVKCRSGLGFGHPLEAITYMKMRTLDSWPRCGCVSIACRCRASDWTPLALCCSPGSSRR
jgi:Holliday junction resolvase-like predicted endonuclease